MAKDTERGREVSLSLYAYRTLLEAVERFARQNSTLAVKVEELLASASTPSRLVEVDASAFRDERRYPSPGRKVADAPNALWWPRRLPAPRPLRPNPGWTCYSLKGKECALVGCSVAGLECEVLAKVIARIERQQQRHRSHIPLFLTDSTDFDLFRAKGYVFEYFPGPEKWAECEGAEPWASYAGRRFELIKKKWNLTNVVRFGQEAFPRADRRSAGSPYRLRIIYYPDYSEANPYQTLMYQAVSQEHQVAPGTIDTALSDLVSGAAPHSVVFHLHWEDKIHMDAPDAGAAEQRCHDFVAKIERFIANGGVFVWTVHNLYPHEQRYAEIHRNLCRRLARLVHRVHVHSQAAVPALEASHGLDRSKVQAIAHGNYCGAYKTGSASAAGLRDQLGIGPSERLFLFFGKIRRYKGVQGLLRAFEELGDPRARLVVAGRQYTPVSLEGMSEDAVKRVVVMDRDIPDEDVGALFDAADFVVLPYKAVLTSGSVLLALSLSRPPIVPDFETLQDLVIDGVNGYLFGRDSPGALVGALRRAMNADAATAERMRRNAATTAMRFDWPTAGEQMALLFHRARASARNRAMEALTAPDPGLAARPWTAVRRLGRRLWLGASSGPETRSSGGQDTAEGGRAGPQESSKS